MLSFFSIQPIHHMSTLFVLRHAFNISEQPKKLLSCNWLEKNSPQMQIFSRQAKLKKQSYHKL